jgi:hypothetical protein
MTYSDGSCHGVAKNTTSQPRGKEKAIMAPNEMSESIRSDSLCGGELETLTERVQHPNAATNATKCKIVRTPGRERAIPSRCMI